MSGKVTAPGRVEAEWTYALRPPFDDLPEPGARKAGYKAPEYRFVVEVAGKKAPGPSPKLRIQDRIDAIVEDAGGKALAGVELSLTFADGKTRKKVTTDGSGRLAAPPGLDTVPGTYEVKVKQGGWLIRAPGARLEAWPSEPPSATFQTAGVRKLAGKGEGPQKIALEGIRDVSVSPGAVLPIDPDALSTKVFEERERTVALSFVVPEQVAGASIEFRLAVGIPLKDKSRKWVHDSEPIKAKASGGKVTAEGIEVGKFLEKALPKLERSRALHHDPLLFLGVKLPGVAEPRDHEVAAVIWRRPFPLVVDWLKDHPSAAPDLVKVAAAYLDSASGRLAGRLWSAGREVLSHRASTPKAGERPDPTMLWKAPGPISAGGRTAPDAPRDAHSLDPQVLDAAVKAIAHKFVVFFVGHGIATYPESGNTRPSDTRSVKDYDGRDARVRFLDGRVSGSHIAMKPGGLTAAAADKLKPGSAPYLVIMGCCHGGTGERGRATRYEYRSDGWKTLMKAGAGGVSAMADAFIKKGTRAVIGFSGSLLPENLLPFAKAFLSRWTGAPDDESVKAAFTHAVSSYPAARSRSACLRFDDFDALARPVLVLAGDGRRPEVVVG